MISHVYAYYNSIVFFNDKNVIFFLDVILVWLWSYCEAKEHLTVLYIRVSNYEYSGFDRISHNEWLGFRTNMNLDKNSQISLLPILQENEKGNKN